MKATICLAMALVSLLLASCNPQKATLEDNFKITALTGEEIAINNGFFAKPRSIEIIDSLMIFIDAYNDTCFTAIDLKNKNVINRFGFEGRGPNELSYPNNLFYNKEDRIVSFSIQNPTRYWAFNIDDLAKADINFSERVNLEFDEGTAGFFTFFSIPKSNGKYIGTGMFKDGMYSIWQSDGTRDTVIGSYTVAEEHKTLDPYLLGSGYQGVVKPHPAASLVAYASFQHDLIEVIDCSDEDYTIKRFHGGGFPELIQDNNYMALSIHHPLSFTDLCTTEKYLYALYSGKSYADHEKMGSNCRLLYVFDWDLKPIICYELDHEIATMKVSEDDQTLYSFALNKDEEIVLMNWDMNH